jgi:hypothetical protein
VTVGGKATQDAGYEYITNRSFGNFAIVGSQRDPIRSSALEGGKEAGDEITLAG